MLRWQKITLGVSIGLMVIAAISLVLVYFFVWKSDSSPTSQGSDFVFAHPPQLTLTREHRTFFSADSTDGYGRTVTGDLIDQENNILEPGLNSVDDLARYPLTYALGHPYWDEGVGLMLPNETWAQHLSRFPASTRTATLLADVSDLPAEIMVVEGKTPVVWDQPTNLTLKGLVIRHGGVLLVEDRTAMSLNVEFILIESGGLLQAGASQARYTNNLTVTLTHPASGFSQMGVVASQYSYQIYNPGTRRADPPVQTAFTGTQDSLTNTFGPKVVAVGFNGNLSLWGQVPALNDYQGTWTARETQTQQPWLDKSDLLTVEAPLVNDIPTAYPNVWCRLTDTLFTQNSTEIQVAERDRASLTALWRPGAQIVLSGRSDQYTDFKDPEGLLPVWLNHTDPINQAANLQANQKFQARFSTADKSNGVEVATIKWVDPATGRIALEQPLQFDHDSRHTILNRSGGGQPEQITVETCCHVGLLTRNIVITSQLDAGGSGCNNVEPETFSTGWQGPGGSVRCNSETSNSSGAEVFAQCYQNAALNNAQFCNNQAPPAAQGSWLFGTETLTGCNAIFGGHQMYRYGCSVTLDGIEIYHLGTPANFGSIARYPVHFHLAGWSRSFTEYLLPGTFRQDQWVGSLKTVKESSFTRTNIVANCSNHQSFSRWFTLHGTHEVTLRNNVTFLCYGSGFFIEDGTEIRNTVDHNLALYNLLAAPHPYYNPAPIFANVAADLCMVSVFWWKNNQNRCFRNVAANAPSPVIMIWAVPQEIGFLRGPSTLCLGDALRRLPGLASPATAQGIEGGYLSQNLDTWETVAIDGNDYPCYLPTAFFTENILGDTQSRCMNFGTANHTIPYSLFAENVCYQMLGGLSEFPEAVAASPSDFEGKGGFEGCPGLGYGSVDPGWTNRPSWLPVNGQNSCTDRNSQVIYFQNIWGAGEPGFPYQPLTPSELDNYNAQGLTRSEIQMGNLIPKVFSGFLTYNLGAISTLWGGALWTKQGPSFVLNSCFLESSRRLTQNSNECYSLNSCSADFLMRTAKGETLISTFPPHSSICQVSSGGNGQQAYAAVYPIFYNYLSNGGVALPSNPTLMGGPKFFLSDSVILLNSEYNNSPGAMNNYFFVDTVLPLDQLIPVSVWQNRENLSVMGLYDLDRQQSWRVAPGGRNGSTLGSQPQSVPWNLPTTPSRKYPYLCGDEGLLPVAEDEPTRQESWAGYAINAQVPHFITTTGINLGHHLCRSLAKIPACYNNIDQSFSGDFCCFPGDTCA